MQTAQLYTGTAVGGVTSVFYDLGNNTDYSISLVFSGGGGNLAGDATLLGSLDNTNYGTVDGSTKSNIASGNIIYSVSGAGYRYVKAQYTSSGGTGNLEIKVFLKEQNNCGQ